GARRGDAPADRVDHAGPVLVRDLALTTDSASGARLHVGRVDAGEHNPHAHLARPGLRSRDLSDLDDLLGGTGPVVVRSAHPQSSTPRQLTEHGPFTGCEDALAAADRC